MPAEKAVSYSFQTLMTIVTVSGAWLSKSCVHGTIVHVVSTEPVGLVGFGAPSAKWLAIQTCGQASYSAPFGHSSLGSPPRHSTLSPSLFSLPMTPIALYFATSRTESSQSSLLAHATPEVSSTQ